MSLRLCGQWDHIIRPTGASNVRQIPVQITCTPPQFNTFSTKTPSTLLYLLFQGVNMTTVNYNKTPVLCVSFIITYISINIFTNVLYPWQRQEISINYLHAYNSYKV